MTAFSLKIIKTEAEYEAALERLEVIFDAKRDTPEGDELDLLTLVIDKFEKEHFPIDLPDPVEAIKYRMEQMGYKQKDLADIIGLKSRVSEILSKKRKLTLEMVRKVHRVLNIPTDMLIKEY